MNIQFYLPTDMLTIAQIGVGLFLFALGVSQIISDWRKGRKKR